MSRRSQSEADLREQNSRLDCRWRRLRWTQAAGGNEPRESRKWRRPVGMVPGDRNGEDQRNGRAGAGCMPLVRVWVLF